MLRHFKAHAAVLFTLTITETVYCLTMMYDFAGLETIEDLKEISLCECNASPVFYRSRVCTECKTILLRTLRMKLYLYNNQKVHETCSGWPIN